MGETISVRIPEEDLNEIERISKYERTTKSTMLREVLELGIRNKRLAIALEKFRKNEITAWKASKLAKVPLTKFLDILKDEGLEFHYSEKELEQEFKNFL